MFLGLSAGGVLKPEMVAAMGTRPLILALANPTPEILPEVAHGVRDDVVMATGRSDYPNQVNNVLCFPYIFRGALDVGATTITREMEKAAVYAIAELAEEEQNEVVAAAYGTYDISFGADYLIPKPFDPRLIVRIAPAVAKAAMEGGVATRPLADLEAYEEQLQQFVYHSGAFMKPLFSAAKRIVRGGGKSRIVFTEAKMSACCAPCRSSSTKAWRVPSWWAVRRAAVAHREIRPAPAPGRGRGSHQPRI